MQAYAAYSLLQQPPKRVGFASGCQAFGHRELLGVLRSFGLVVRAGAHASRADPVRLVDYLDKGASLGPGRALPDHGRRDADVRRGAWSSAAGSRRRSAGRGVRARRQGRDPVRQRPGRLHVRVRDQPGRRRLVPGQPAQRGGGEPRAARPVRLLGADLPGVVRAAGRARSAHDLPAADHPGLPRRRGRRRADLGRVPRRTASARRRRVCGRRPRHDRRHRRHDRAAQGRDADRHATSRR